MSTEDEMDQYKCLSRNLYNVMENCCFTAEVRDTQIEMTRILEILHTLAKPLNLSICYFGSNYEGTATRNASDVDMVYIDNRIPVVTSTGEFPSQDSLLLVPDIQPGYVRLQIVTNDIPVFSNTTNLISKDIKYDLQVDKDDRICWIANPHYIPDGYGRQGPAFHTETNYHGELCMYDLVFAFKCTQWPSLASEWLHRQRNNGWPTPELIEKCKTLGFLVVAASHPDSDRKELQWRISFSEQERLLVTQFNSVQLMCYVLLKTIKNEIVKRQIEEDTLTSYHCKTCMLYMLENKPHEFWIPENLVICLNTCLRQIHAWVKDNNCPNYFIPEENMFDRIIEVNLKEKLLRVLDKLLKSDIRTMLEQVIENDIGKKLTESFQTTQELQWKENIQVNKAQRMENLLCSIINFRNYLLVKTYDEILNSLINNLEGFYRNLKATKTITNHSENETKTALSFILPFIKVHELSCKVVQKIQAGESYQEILTCEEWDKQWPIHGYSKLKQAMAMSVLGKHLDSLNLISVDLNSKKISLCQCGFDNSLSPAEKSLVFVPYKDDFTVVKVLNCYQPCVVFLPAEQLITHAAINYEMIRSYAMPPFLDSLSDPPDDRSYHWLKWGVVDGIFMAYFLLYLHTQYFSLNSEATTFIKKMQNLLKRKCVYHRETCLNLLGWIHKERGDNNQAVQCFSESIKMRSTYNAAFWHFSFMICGY